MPWGIAIGAAATLGAGALQAGAAGDAADAQAAANAAATAEQRRQYDQTRQDMMPWMNAGIWGLNQQQNALRGDWSGFEDSPDYLYAYQQGMKGLDRQNAANLSLTSGGADADRIALGQGLASQNFNNYYNRLAGLSGTGQTTATQLGGFGQNAANQIGQNTINAGNARASGYTNTANAWGNALTGLAGGINYTANQRGWWG